MAYVFTDTKTYVPTIMILGLHHIFNDCPIMLEEIRVAKNFHGVESKVEESVAGRARTMQNICHHCSEKYHDVNIPMWEPKVLLPIF